MRGLLVVDIEWPLKISHGVIGDQLNELLNCDLREATIHRTQLFLSKYF